MNSPSTGAGIGKTLQRKPRGATRRQYNALFAPDRDQLLWGGVSLLVLVLLSQLFIGVFSSDTNDETVLVPDPLVTATTQVAWDAVTEGQILKPDEPPIIWNDVTVRNGDNLSLIFNRAGFSDRDVYEVTSSDTGRALRKIFPGQLIGFAANEDNELIAVRHIESPLKQTVYSKSEGQFVSEIITRETQTRERSVTLTLSLIHI